MPLFARSRGKGAATSRGTKIVVLGRMARSSSADVLWLTAHYLVGLRRLGYDPYYVETRTGPTAHDEPARAAALIDGVLRRFDLGDRWAYHVLASKGGLYGLTESRWRELFRSAALVLNLDRGTMPLPEHAATGRLVYVESDAVGGQVGPREAAEGARDFLEPHVAFFSCALNLGNEDCALPLPERFPFRPSCPPVVLDLWRDRGDPGGAFTTIGKWGEAERELRLAGSTFLGSTHSELLKMLDLPRRVGGTHLELALESPGADDRRLLDEHGWHVHDARQLCGDLDLYRDYLAGSRAELTVATDQDVRLRSGRFEGRSAAYLAAGRPVVAQDTGFTRSLPAGVGLVGFSSVEEAAAAIEAVEGDYARHAQAAAELARDRLDSDRVLTRLLAEVALPVFPPNLSLMPVSRRPTTLASETVEAVLEAPLPAGRAAAEPAASVIVPTHDGLVFTRLCLESVLATTDLELELIVVDNASSDGTRDYLQQLAARDPRVRPLLGDRNLGFPGAVNKGLRAARAPLLLILHNDTLVSTGSLERLARSLADDPSLGLVGAVADPDAGYQTLAELASAWQRRAGSYEGRVVDVPTLTMFCTGMRRAVYERVGPLDENFGLGPLSDDDYSLRVLRAWFRVAVAENVLVHHFGEATGEHAELFERNRRLFEEKWGVEWERHRDLPSQGYRQVVGRIREVVGAATPPGARVLVASRGDEDLLRLGGRLGAHFPQLRSGIYAGWYPADSSQAIGHLEELRSRGADYLLFPSTAFWWLEHYEGLDRHLRRRYHEVVRDDACILFSLQENGSRAAGEVRAESIRRLLRQPRIEVPTQISPNDLMYDEGGDARYWQCGESALQCVRLALLAAGKDDVGSILDLGCGHGRVLRWLKAAFPDAQLTACDIDPDAVEFCARTFGATPAYSREDPAQIELDGEFDLIWSGSLLTHLDRDRWQSWLELCSRRLATGGILLFTTSGNRVAELVRSGTREFAVSTAEDLLADYERDGFAYQSLPKLRRRPIPGRYGVSLSSPAWVCARLEELPRLRLLSYTEQGWDETQDVVACVGLPSRVADFVAPDGLPVPPPELQWKVIGRYNPEGFLERGKLGIDILTDALRRRGVDPHGLGPILDWGCGCGRVLRYWKDIDGPRVHGCDYNPDLVEWCRENLPFASVAVNGLAPPLPFEAESFDFVYALSVFTHLTEAMHHAWMREIDRVLRPRGLFFFTTHGSGYLHGLDEFDRARFQAGELVVTNEGGEGSNRCAAFQPNSWVERNQLRGFELLEFSEQGARCNGRQDFYLVRKGRPSAAHEPVPS